MKITYYKTISGVPTILNGHMDNVKMSDMTTQKSLILNELMRGRKLSRFDVQEQPIGCLKLPSRIGELEQAMIKKGVKIKHIEKKSLRGKACYTYYIDKNDIEKLRA